MKLPPDTYTTKQIAEACGVSIWLVTRYLRENYPNHERAAWWRLSGAEYRAVCQTLKGAKMSCPRQPLHAIRKPHRFLKSLELF